jgi:hypothetical protein
VWSDDYIIKKKTDLIPINEITKVPIGMFVGKYDLVASPTDCQWIRDQLPSDTLVHYKEYDAGHSTLLLGKDMSPFVDDAMNLIELFTPIDNDTR